MKKYYLFISLALLIGLSSCSSLRIDKRHYSNGWYVDFSKDRKSDATTATTNEQETTVSQTPSAPVDNATVEQPAPVQSNSDQAAVNAPQKNTVVAADDQSGATTTGKETTVNKDDQQTQEQTSQPANTQPTDSDINLVLLVILAIILPPLAVYLVQGVTTIFWITLICWLFEGFFFWGHGILFLGGLGLVAIILALLVVFGKL